jgi:catechol 2,3-dioxygenase-like lactoylglutathione lyase family enzyme
MTTTRPTGLNHVAYVTRDTLATKRFYTEVLGMRLVNYARDESVGSTGEPIEGVEQDHHDSPLPRWAPHLALSVGSREELEAAHRRLTDEGIEVRGVVEHEGIWSSIYFFDPNGVRLELTYQNRALTDADAEAAEQAVDDWLREHSSATA